MDMMVELREMVLKAGFAVHTKTKFCEDWHKNGHENCSGCESEEGCARYVMLCMVMTKPIVYTPTSFEDSLKMDKWIQESTLKILDKNVPMSAIRDIL